MITRPILIGKNADGYLEFGGDRHVALHAPSGSGKTSQFVIPNAFSWPGSLVVLDIKSQVFKATAGHRANRLGQDVWMFNPSAVDSRSHCWNPLEIIERDSIDRFDQIMRQSYALFPEMLGDSNAARFWEPAGRQAFIAVVALLAETPEEPLTLANVLRVFMRGDYFEWLTSRIEKRRAEKQPYSAPVVEAVSDFLCGNADMVTSIRKTVSTVLQGFWNPRVASATSTNHFDLRQLRRRPTTLYVSIAPAHIPRMRPILRLLFDQVINQNSDVTLEEDPSLNVPVLMLMDEFVQLGKVPTVAYAGQYIRDYGFLLAYVIQDKAQLVGVYDQPSARDIFSNLGVEIVFGTGDIELAGELEKRLGDDTVIYPTINRPRFFSKMKPSKQGISEHPHRVPVMFDHEIVQMSREKQIVLGPGMPPMQTERITWYEDEHFKSLVVPPPTIPRLDIQVRQDDGSVMIPARRTR